MRSLSLYTINGIIFVGIAVLLLLPLSIVLPGVPDIWYRVDAKAPEAEIDQLIATSQDLQRVTTEIINSSKLVLPPFDSSLPTENRVLINSIGVNGLIREGSDAKKTLAQGIWRHNQFGTPLNTASPMILASHRYGNARWSKEFRDREIFYNLDKVKAGDTVEIIWQQRLYKYKVMATEVNKSVSNLDFDVLLYTCNYWNSPLRIFVYLERV